MLRTSTTAVSAASAAGLIRERSAHVTRAADLAAVEFREFSRKICEPNTDKRNSESTLALALGLLTSGLMTAVRTRMRDPGLTAALSVDHAESRPTGEAGRCGRPSVTT